MEQDKLSKPIRLAPGLTDEEYNSLDNNVYLEMASSQFTEMAKDSIFLEENLRKELKELLKHNWDVDGFLLDNASGNFAFLVAPDKLGNNFRPMKGVADMNGLKVCQIGKDSPIHKSDDFKRISELHSDILAAVDNAVANVIHNLNLSGVEMHFSQLSVKLVKDRCFIRMVNPKKRSYIDDPDMGCFVLSQPRANAVYTEHIAILNKIKTSAFYDYIEVPEADYKKLVEEEQKDNEKSKQLEKLAQLRARKAQKPQP